MRSIKNRKYRTVKLISKKTDTIVIILNKLLKFKFLNLVKKKNLL